MEKSDSFDAQHVEPDPLRQRNFGTPTHLVSLNFKVPFEFRQRLKILAAHRAMTMTELLTAAVDNFIENKEIHK